MSAFRTHTGRIAVYADANVDTDRIIPARFLSRVSRQGYGELLFADVRGPEFSLDKPEAAGATVLVTGTNFGCGSSREHAVWAIQQAGFVAVISAVTPESPGFSDIFRQNAANCGLLLVELPAADHQSLVQAGTSADCTVNLEQQTVSVGGKTLPFEINPALREQLLAGHDLIGTTLVYEDKIDEFEGRWTAFAPGGRNSGAAPASKG